jgi:hypothetical protein
VHGFGHLLAGLSIPEDVAQTIVARLESEHEQTGDRTAAERGRLQRALALLRTRQHKALTAKLDRDIPEELWQRNQTAWQSEALRHQAQLNHLDEGESGEGILSVRRAFELAQNTHCLYVMRTPAEQAELLKSVLLNCAIDDVSLYPTFRKPFDRIVKRAKSEEWSTIQSWN